MEQTSIIMVIIFAVFLTVALLRPAIHIGWLPTQTVWKGVSLISVVGLGAFAHDVLQIQEILAYKAGENYFVYLFWEIAHNIDTIKLSLILAMVLSTVIALIEDNTGKHHNGR